MHQCITGIWYSNNCGRRKAYVCEKDPDSDEPIEPEPTDPVPGFCADGWFGLGKMLFHFYHKKASCMYLKHGC